MACWKSRSRVEEQGGKGQKVKAGEGDVANPVDSYNIHHEKVSVPSSFSLFTPQINY